MALLREEFFGDREGFSAEVAVSEDFDPYHKWLAIPPEDQPPNHYRLLAVNLFESDADVISGAADQRMTHVRSFQIGKRSALSQQILNEISAARICLLNPEKKAEYDAELRSKLAEQEAEEAGRRTPPPDAPKPAPAPPKKRPPKPPAPDRIAGLSAVADDQPARLTDRVRRSKPKWQLPVAVGGLLVLSIAIAAVLMLPRGQNTGGLDHQDAPAVTPPDDPPQVATGEDPPAEPAEKETRDPPVEPDDPVVADPPPEDPPPQPPPEPPKAKSPQPDDTALAGAVQQIKTGIAGKPPGEVIAEATARADYDIEGFAMLLLARDSAAAAGDLRTAFRAVDELEKRFVVDTLDMKAAILPKLQESAGDQDTFKEIARQALVMVDQAVKLDRPDLANRCATVALSAARKSGDAGLNRQATLRILKLQQ